MRQHRLLRLISLYLLLSLLCALLPLAPAHAREADEGYRITSYHVDVTAGTDRAYTVTETITMDFLDERHGFIRTIPLSGDVEGYTVSDISVTGAPFEVTETYSNVEIKIGDADTTITGEHQYVIRYRLVHYADYDPTADFLYLNLVGTDWDTSIDSFTATVRFPDGASADEITVTGGRYGSGSMGDRVSYTVENGVLSLQTNGGLDAFEGVTLQAQFPEGTFSEAPVFVPDVTINSLATSIDVGESRRYRVQSDYVITVNSEEATHFSGIIDDRDLSGDNLHLSGLTVQCEDAEVYLSDDSSYFAINFEEGSAGKVIRFSLSYDAWLRYAPGEEFDQLSFELFPYFGETEILDLSIDITGPYPIRKMEASVGRRGESDPEQRLSIVREDTGVSFQSLRKFTAGEQFSLKLYYPAGSFLYEQTALDVSYPAVGIAALLLVAVLALFLGRRKKVPPVLSFRPPQGMSSAELGYIIDERCDGRDITSLIYYWASHGHLTIEMQPDDHFTLHRKNELDDAHPFYEKEMFSKLFSGGRQTVTDTQLENKFYKTVNKTATLLKKAFTGPRQITNIACRGLSYLLRAVLTAALLPMCFVPLFLGSEPAILGLIIALLLGVAGQMLVASLSADIHKGVQLNKVLRLLGILLCYAGAVLGLASDLTATGMMAKATGLLFAASYLAAMFLSPLIKKRTAFGYEQLALALGFRDFLVTAEKDRLEMLLNEEPDYFYNVLPFAQVLGVSKKWEKKFDGLLSEPPSWLYSSDPAFTFTAYSVMHRMHSTMDRVSSTMTSSPSSSGGGGGGGSFSGGGGGFSGGGFSGGGSGGGGGSSW